MNLASVIDRAKRRVIKAGSQAGAGSGCRHQCSVGWSQSIGGRRAVEVADAVRAIGVTEVTYYRWRQEFGGLKTDQVKRMKELEAENARLRRAVSDLTLDKMILAEAAKGNF